MVSIEDILAITDNVFTMMLGTSAEPGKKAFSMSGSDDQVTGCIQISGEWCGVIMLQTSFAFVSQAASRMLSMSEDELEQADRQDAIAELTNMIGGNIKSLLPGPSYLSLPSVTMGREFAIRVYGTVVESVVPVSCGDEQICISIYRAAANET